MQDEMLFFFNFTFIFALAFDGIVLFISFETFLGPSLGVVCI